MLRTFWHSSQARRTGLRAGAVSVCALVVALGLTACGGGSGGTGSGGSTGASGEGGSSPASGGEKLTVGLILEGPKNDKSFNEAAYLGVQKVVEEDPNVELTSVLENREETQDQSEAVETLAGVDKVVIGTGAQFGPIFDNQAPKYPDTTFLTLGGYPQNFHENVYSIAFDRVAAYVTGVLAAHLTKDKTVGFVGGAEIPPVEQSLVGVEAAIKSADPSIKLLKNVVGDFNDVAKAKAASAAMLADGADVIIGYVDAGIAGVYAAADEAGKNVPVFKLDLLECSGYGNIVGANIGDNTEAAYQLLSGVAKGTLKPAGVTIFAGLQDPALQRVALCPKYEKNKEFSSLLEETVTGINDGSIQVPKEELNPRPNYPYREGLEGPVKQGE
ncbi:MAG: BMP family ABC transporter substrate-binding protein [Actinobacteria bacterium]|nr:BMP family ABC transporter substrate-binding protein [Actinomycetota bacterium]